MDDKETTEQSTTTTNILTTASNKCHIIETIFQRRNDDDMANEVELDALRMEHSNIDNLLNALLNEAAKRDSAGFKRERKCEELSEQVGSI